MKHCVSCRQTLDVTEFNRRRKSADGLQNVCRTCNRAQARRYYRENRTSHLAIIRVRTEAAKRLARLIVGEHLMTHPCVDCGESDVRVLDFDHLPGMVKTKNVMVLANDGYSPSRLRAEIAHCAVRCRNCHARVTSERRDRDWRTELMNRGTERPKEVGLGSAHDDL